MGLKITSMVLIVVLFKGVFNGKDGEFGSYMGIVQRLRAPVLDSGFSS